MKSEEKQRLVKQFLDGNRVSQGISSIKENFSEDKLGFSWIDETLGAFQEAMEAEWGEKLKFAFLRLDFKYDPNSRLVHGKLKRSNILWRFLVAPKGNPSDQFVLFEINIFRDIVDNDKYILSDEWELWIDCWNDVPVKIILKEESKYASSLAVEILRSINNVQFVSQLKKHILLNDFLNKEEN